jgi:hypothetical protein
MIAYFAAPVYLDRLSRRRAFIRRDVLCIAMS